MSIAMNKTHSARSGVLRTVLGIALALLLIIPMVAEDVFASSSALQSGMTPIYGRDIEDGTWPIEVRSNSKYFKIASCQLTVKGDEMTAVLTMNSTSYSYAYPGTKLEAKKDDAGRIEMDVDNENYTLTYEMDVPALNAEVPCAAYSKRRKKWYDRNLVFVAGSLPAEALKIELPDYDLIEQALEQNGGVPAAADATADADEAADEGDTISEDSNAAGTSQNRSASQGNPPEAASIDHKDGEYSIEVVLEGGSGRASVTTPTWLIVKDGKAYAKLLWSSPHYDYMLVNGYRYDNETTDGGNSTFTIPITKLDEPMSVIADTTAMGDPVAINYTLTFFTDSIGPKSAIPQEATKKIIVVAAVVIVLGGILNYFVKRGRR